MGLTWKRAGFAALVLAAVLLPLRRPAPVLEPTANMASRLDQVELAYYRARFASSALAERDSALALAAIPHVATPVPPVIFSGFPRGTSDPGGDALVGNLWRTMGKTDTSVHTIVMAYNAASSISGYSGALFVHGGSRTDCVAIVPANTLANGSVRVRQVALIDAIAPCALWAAFGPPGPAVRAWLERTRYVEAQSVNWLESLRSPSQFTAGPWLEWSDFDRNRTHGFDAQLFDVADALGADEFVASLAPPYEMGTAGLRCLTGDAPACVEGVLHPAVEPHPVGAIPQDLTVPTRDVAPDGLNVATPRPAQPFLISQLISDRGRDRFARFWASNQPVDVAFENAYGEPLGTWTAAWAHREWLGTFAAHFRGDVLLGATLRPGWLLVVAGWTGLALLVAAGVAARRTG